MMFDEDPSDEKKSEHSSNRIERILNILKTLQDRWCSQEDLLKLHPDYSKRTFYRDLEDIRQYFGNAIQTNKDGQFHFVPDGTIYFRSLDLTYVEALSLYLLCQLGSRSERAIPYLETATAAMQKLRCLGYGLFDEDISEQARMLHVELAPCVYCTNAQIFSALLHAQHTHHSVKLVYDSIFDRGKIQTFVEPYLVHFMRRAWYVTGRSSFHSHEIRSFHLERIVSLEIQENMMFFTPENWNYDMYRGNAWNMICGPEDVEIHLHFTKKVARNVAAVNWHKTQKIKKNGDGTIEFFVKVAGTMEILWWILGYGPEVEVIEPESLRREVREGIRAMSRIYENDTINPPASEPQT